MTDVEAIGRLALALAVGLIVGIERGWVERHAAEGSRVAGVRTFALLGLLGGLSARLSDGVGAAQGAILLGAGFATVALTIAAARAAADPPAQGNSITTAVAALVTYGLGALAARALMVEALGGAVATALLLDLKPAIHGFVRRLEQRDVLAGLQFILVAGVVLPLLPDRGYGPAEAVNPREIWFMVVLVAGLSFCGYAAVRVAGARIGIMLTAVFGSLVSSTAVTMALSRLGRAQPDAGLPVASGIVLASAVMALRVAVLVLIVNPGLLTVVAAPLAAVLLGAVLAAVLIWPRAAATAAPGPVPVANPLDLRSALGFGLVLAAVLALEPVVRDWLGDVGVLALAALSGLTDVDAITLAMARFGEDPAVHTLAGSAVALAIGANMIAKAAIAASGGAEARTKAAPALACLALCCGLGLGVALWIA